jgi:hypothetical protein
VNKVRGCVSQVWLELGDGANAAGERVLHYRGDSDSHLVRGLIAIALALYSDRTVSAQKPAQIAAGDAQLGRSIADIDRVPLTGGCGDRLLTRLHLAACECGMSVKTQGDASTLRPQVCCQAANQPQSFRKVRLARQGGTGHSYVIVCDI